MEDIAEALTVIASNGSESIIMQAVEQTRSGVLRWQVDPSGNGWHGRWRTKDKTGVTERVTAAGNHWKFDGDDDVYLLPFDRCPVTFGELYEAIIGSVIDVNTNE
jgi:hypothetical protein